MRRSSWAEQAYDSRDGEIVFLGILEKGQDIITDDDALLSLQNVLDTHVEDV